MGSLHPFLDAACEAHELGDECSFFAGWLPEQLTLGAEQFDDLWELHPADFHEIMMFGRRIKTPRWQQAYGQDYRFSGQVSRALPVPTLVEPHLEWAQKNIHHALNGALLNWYDGRLGHYIGPHNDDTRDLVPSTPIVTMSFGESRIFRFSREARKFDFLTEPGSVIVIPWSTNLLWKHSVPRLKKDRSRRVSITLRAFEVAPNPNRFEWPGNTRPDRFTTGPTEGAEILSSLDD